MISAREMTNIRGNTNEELIAERERIAEGARASLVEPNRPPPWLERAFRAINAELRKRGFDAPDDVRERVTYLPEYGRFIPDRDAETLHPNRMIRPGHVNLRGVSATRVALDEAETINFREIELAIALGQQRGNNMEETEARNMPEPPPHIVAQWASLTGALAPNPATSVLWRSALQDANLPENIQALMMPTHKKRYKEPAPATSAQLSTPVEQTLKVTPEAAAIIEEAVGTRVAMLKANGFALLQQWIIQGKLVKHASNIDDAEFFTKNKKALMTITVCADEYNLTDEDINAEDFIEMVKGTKPRFMSVQKEIKAVLEAKKAQAIKAKEGKILSADNGFASSMMKTFLQMETPLIHPADQIKSDLAVAQTNQRSLVQNVDRAWRDYLEELRAAEEEADNISKLQLQYKALKDEPSVDMFAEIKAFCMKADGVNFPFKFKYANRESENSYRFVFGKPSFKYKDPDSEIERIICPIDIVVNVARDSGAWRYTITAKREDDLGFMMRYGGNVFGTDYLKYFHAHVNVSGGICLGTAGEMIAKMRTNMAKIGDSLMVIDSLLKTYNPGSPYISMTNAFHADAHFIYKSVNRFRTGDGDFQKNLRDSLVKGEISLTEYYKALMDRVMEVLTTRGLALIDANVDRYDGLAYLRECNPGSTIRRYRKQSPFSSDEQENYFMDYMRDYFYLDNLNGVFSDRLNRMRPDLAGHETFTVEVFDFFLDYVRHHFDCYLRFVQTCEANLDYYSQFPDGIHLGDTTIDKHNIKFQEWFTTKRKKS